jgi:hypothetical protein
MEQKHECNIICCVCGKHVKGTRVKKVKPETEEGKFLTKYFNTFVVDGLMACQNCVRQISTLNNKLSQMRSGHINTMAKLNAMNLEDNLSSTTANVSLPDTVSVNENNDVAQLYVAPCHLSPPVSVCDEDKACRQTPRQSIVKRFLSPATPLSCETKIKRNRPITPREPIVKRLFSPSSSHHSPAGLKQTDKRCCRELTFGEYNMQLRALDQLLS